MIRYFNFHFVYVATKPFDLSEFDSRYVQTIGRGGELDYTNVLEGLPEWPKDWVLKFSSSYRNIGQARVKDEKTTDVLYTVVFSARFVASALFDDSTALSPFRKCSQFGNACSATHQN